MFEFGFFGQDDFRVNSRLVLNLGLRYDFYSNNVVKPTGDVPVGIVNLSPATDLHRFNFGPPRPLDNPVEHDGWANLGPRLGFAYDFDGKGKTVVRGGFGVLFAGQVPALYRQSVAHPVVPFGLSTAGLNPSGWGSDTRSTLKKFCRSWSGMWRPAVGN